MKRITLLFVCCFPFLSNAQFDFNPDDLTKLLDGSIESDRPGQAMNPRSCGIMTIQLQTGGSFARSTFNPNGHINSFSTPTQLKLGLTGNLELNTSFSYIYSDYDDGFFEYQFGGFPSPSINLRYTVLNGDKWKPYLGIQAGFTPSSSRGNFQQPQFGSSYFLLTSNRFDKLSVNTNFGVSFSGFGLGADTYVLPYVVNLGYAINSKWSVFAEAFGEARSSSLNIDGGVAYGLNSSLQLDAFGGWLGGNSWFAEIGLTWKYSFLKAMAKKKINELFK
ncbi:MAG: hypothetical protein ABJG68_12905 [Crocinitomicaceae bacterium]